MTHQANVRSDVQHDAVRVQLDTVLKVAIQSEYLHRHHPAVRSRPQPADRRLGFRFPGEEKRVTIPQAARGRLRPPCRHFKILSCFCLALLSKPWLALQQRAPPPHRAERSFRVAGGK
jgi:hypothetical protein